MQSERKAISPLLYYTLLSGLTNLTFFVVGVVAFALSSLRITDKVVVIAIAILLLWKGGLVGFVSWLFHKKSHNKEFAVKFIGLYLGRFFGIFIGGFIGARIAYMLRQADIIGFIIGALALYFIGWWIGSKVSISIGGQLDKVFSISETQGLEKVVEAKPPNRFVLVLYIMVLPLLFVIIGLLINYFDIPVGYLVELLPISRIMVIALSIFSISYPWIMRKRWLMKFQSTTSSPESVTSWLGLSLSVVPAGYGIILFFAMGASLIELCFFAAASSVAAIIWSANNLFQKGQKAG